MFVKNLQRGQRFTTPDSGGTVYVCESVRVQDGYAYLTYIVESAGIRSGYGTYALSTVNLVSDVENVA